MSEPDQVLGAEKKSNKDIRMKSQAVCIDRADHSIVQATDVKEPDQHQILIHTSYTIISPGTELAIYRGFLEYAPSFSRVWRRRQGIAGWE